MQDRPNTEDGTRNYGMAAMRTIRPIKHPSIINCPICRAEIVAEICKLQHLGNWETSFGIRGISFSVSLCHGFHFRIPVGRAREYLK